MASLQANGATITAPGSNGLGGAGNQGYFGVMSQASGMGVQVGNNVDRVWRLPTQEDRDASINMLPNADPTTLHSCDACNKDITGVRVYNSIPLPTYEVSSAAPPYVLCSI